MKNKICVFLLDDHAYGLWLESVVRVERMVWITPLPKAPEIIIGIINVRGTVVPVVNIRKRFNLPQRRPTPTDQLIIVKTAARSLAICVDRVVDLVDVNEDDIVDAHGIFRDIEYTAGVLKLKGELIIIHDIDRFFSPSEDLALEEALKGCQHQPCPG